MKMIFAECLICQMTSQARLAETNTGASNWLVDHSREMHKDQDGKVTGFRVHGVIHEQERSF